MISMLSLFECIIRSSPVSLEEVKLIAIVNWIFYISDYLRLFIMYFKYDLISSRYSLIDRISFLSSLPLYYIKLFL